MDSLLIASCAFLILMWTWRLLDWVWFKPKKLERYLRQQGLDGNSYRLFYGDLKERTVMTKKALSTTIKVSDYNVPRVIPYFYHLTQKYGKNSFTWQGPVPSVIVMDPKLIKEVLSKHDIFQKPFVPIGKLFLQGIHIVPAVHFSCDKMISSWEKLLEEGSTELDVKPYLGTLSGDIIARAAFGSNYEEGKKIFELQEEQFKRLFEVLQSIQAQLPGWRFFPTKTNKRMREINKEVYTLVKGIIHKREMEITKAGDLLGMLMDSNSKEIQDNNSKKSGLSIDDIVEECKVFFLAGQETTQLWLTWVMVLLSSHSYWQTKAREEVLQVFGKNKPGFDDLNDLKIITMILYEALRLYPVASNVTRKVCKTTKLEDMTLPAGVHLVLPIIQVHQDPQIWGEDAKEFNPERFSAGVSNASKGQSAFFGFSWGPRICVGQNFAVMEAKLALVMILQRFSFQLAPSYTHAPMALFNTIPQYGAKLILQKV
ncbi:Cytochrome P450 [Dillenia turbinata]|uniref:Cytochrome P450 n=1 Tax=Dillenia turbinata TaxID=194707 RepID=A0AAN8V685_9MAGN